MYSVFMASLITAPVCGRYCLIGLCPDLESNTNMVLLYEPVAKRARSGHDDTHSSAPGTLLEYLTLMENDTREMSSNAVNSV